MARSQSRRDHRETTPRASHPRRLHGWQLWLGGGLGAAVLFLVVGSLASPAAQSQQIRVYKLATCGCCEKWMAHLQDRGFRVQATDVGNLGAIKAEHGVPSMLGSCHTALVGDYVVEGHVPADAIIRLLDERPPIVGLAVPGMPAGSPGMESPRPVRYNVVAFDGSGTMRVYERY